MTLKSAVCSGRPGSRAPDRGVGNVPKPSPSGNPWHCHNGVVMGPLQIIKHQQGHSDTGVCVDFGDGQKPVWVARNEWVGFDFDGTIARTDNPGHFQPPFPLGQPIPEMVDIVKSLLTAGITVKIFTARACDPASIPAIQDWTEREGLGRLDVTAQKDYHLIRFFDDRAIQVVLDQGCSNTATRYRNSLNAARLEANQS